MESSYRLPTVRCHVSVKNSPAYMHDALFQALAWLRFVDEYCKTPQYVLKIDDDVVFDLYALINYLRVNIEESPRTDPDNLFICGLLDGQGLAPSRDPNFKWYFESYIDRGSNIPRNVLRLETASQENTSVFLKASTKTLGNTGMQLSMTVNRYHTNLLQYWNWWFMRNPLRSANVTTPKDFS